MGDCSHPRAKAISASPGKGQEKQPWHIQTWQSKYGGIHQFSTVLLPLCTSLLGFSGCQGSPLTCQSGVKAASGTQLRKDMFTPVLPTWRFSAGSNSDHSQALAQIYFKCLKTRTWNSNAWTRAPASLYPSPAVLRNISSVAGITGMLLIVHVAPSASSNNVTYCITPLIFLTFFFP